MAEHQNLMLLSLNDFHCQLEHEKIERFESHLGLRFLLSLLMVIHLGVIFYFVFIVVLQEARVYKNKREGNRKRHKPGTNLQCMISSRFHQIPM